MKEYTFFYTIKTYDSWKMADYESGMKSSKGRNAVEAGNELLKELKNSKPFAQVIAFNLIKD